MWILILTLLTNTGAALTSAEFDTKNMEDLPLILKKHAEKLKEIRLKDDFV